MIDSSPERVTAVREAIEAVVESARRLQGPRSAPFAAVDLTRRQLEVLYLLAHREQVTPTLLATTMNVTAGAVTQLVSVLRDYELVESAPHPEDGRSIVLVLTASARRDVEAFESAFVLDALPSFTGLTTRRLRQLTGLLAAIKEAP